MKFVKMAPDRLGQDSKYWLNSDEIFKDVGWQQEILWELGLKDMVDWGNKYINELRNYPMDYILRA